MRKKILFVDDDRQYQDFVSELLTVEGYDVTCAENANEGFRLFKSEPFDLVLSDLKMEVIDGLQFFSLLKRIKEDVKVIILTGSNNDQDEVNGLDLMVSDYIKKPVSAEILLKRISRVLKVRTNVVDYEHDLRSDFEEIVVNLKTRKVHQGGELVELTRKEYGLLLFLLQNKNAVQTREKIVEAVWHHRAGLSDMRTVDTHIKKLRSKMRLSTINSIRGVGYEWTE